MAARAPAPDSPHSVTLSTQPRDGRALLDSAKAEFAAICQRRALGRDLHSLAARFIDTPLVVTVAAEFDAPAATAEEELERLRSERISRVAEVAMVLRAIARRLDAWDVYTAINEWADTPTRLEAVGLLELARDGHEGDLERAIRREAEWEFSCYAKQLIAGFAGQMVPDECTATPLLELIALLRVLPTWPGGSGTDRPVVAAANESADDSISAEQASSTGGDATPVAGQGFFQPRMPPPPSPPRESPPIAVAGGDFLLRWEGREYKISREKTEVAKIVAAMWPPRQGERKTDEDVKKAIGSTAKFKKFACNKAGEVSTILGLIEFPFKLTGKSATESECGWFQWEQVA